MRTFIRTSLILASTALLAGAGPASPPRSTYYGNLYDGEQGQLDLTLYAGNEYQYDGVCDVNCNDLDFVLYRWNGTRWIWAAEDKAMDDVPTVVAAPRRTGVYRLVIIMAGCGASGRCRYEVDVY
ncbi:hypothetical protein [Longimicrobium sp.]|uniref:hypothetical protein n=1 Tax=Longimicrobium sp. TaxID=2029185 RepID=UPI002E3155B3|nr:hypothetical protein [Longimicrobium sp.]HEX6036492.1 hypothetical protein [Longimicrobium sp.]